MGLISDLIPATCNSAAAEAQGFRLGGKGTHTSRTMMLTELEGVLTVTPDTATREEYAAAIVAENCLGKPTTATRLLTNQRLGELYGLDPGIAIFRVLRRLWSSDAPGRSLLAVQCALARDPLFAATFAPVISLPEGSELQRDQVRAALMKVVDGRLNDATVNKVIRNAASSWVQSGHLVGRTFKKRVRVWPTPQSVAYSLFLGRVVGFRGIQIFSSPWVTLLDCTPTHARELALEAKRIGLIDLRISGDVVDISFERLERAA